MCPACIATAAVWIAASATSTGGVSALVVQTLRSRFRAKHSDPVNLTSGERDGTSDNRVTV